jgi:hypothetical protein
MVLGSALSPVAAQAGLPVARLFSVNPAGGKQGSSVEVTIAGADLEGVTKLHFSAPGITAAQKTVPPGLGETGLQGVPGQFTITIAPEAKPGICEVRAVGKYGVSNPRSFVVGTQAEIVEVEPNNTLDKATEVALGTLVNGQSNAAADQDFFKINAKAGQRIIADCWAYRIDSRMTPQARSWITIAIRIGAIRCWISPCRPTACITSKSTTSSTPAATSISIVFRLARSRISITSFRRPGCRAPTGNTRSTVGICRADSPPRSSRPTVSRWSR